MANDLDLEVLLKLQDRATGPLNQSLGKIDRQTKKSTRNIASVGRALRSHWLVATAVIIGATVAFSKIVGAAIDFEDAFAGVRKTVDATEEEFRQLNAGLREMALTIPVTVIELAEIQTIAGQLGVRGVKSLTRFTEVVAKIAVTTNLTREAAATNFARIANIMQESLENVDRMGSAVVELGNNFATTELEIVSFATRIAGASRVVGLSTADIFAFGTAFSSVGVQAQRGGTAVSKALILMSTAAEEGGEKLQDFADIAGLTTEEFKRGFEEDAAKVFALFIEGLGREGRKGAEILKELELGDQRLIQAFLSVGGASGILTKAIEQSNEAFEENIALNEEASKRFATTASQIKLLKNNFNELNIELGDAALPATNALMEALTEKMRGFTDADLEVWEAWAALFAFEGSLITGLIEVASRLREVREEGEETGEQLNQMWQTLAFVPKPFQKAMVNTIKLQKEVSKTVKKDNAIFLDFSEKQIEAFNKQAEAASFYFTFLSQALMGAAQENKTLARAAQAVALAQAIMNTAIAVTKAFSDYSFPFSLIVGGIMAAAGAIQIATIASQKFHQGGVVKAHDGLAVDEVPIIAQRGEGVLSRKGMQAIGGSGALNDINRGGGVAGLTVNIENASFESGQDIEDVLFEISTAIEEQRRARI